MKLEPVNEFIVNPIFVNNKNVVLNTPNVAFAMMIAEPSYLEPDRTFVQVEDYFGINRWFAGLVAIISFICYVIGKIILKNKNDNDESKLKSYIDIFHVLLIVSSAIFFILLLCGLIW